MKQFFLYQIFYLLINFLDSCDFITFYLLPRLLWSSNSIEYDDAIQTKKIWIPTKEESQESLLLIVPVSHENTIHIYLFFVHFHFK